MTYESIIVKLSAAQVKEAVKDAVRKDFTHHNIVDVKPHADGGMTVEIKSAGNYMDR